MELDFSPDLAAMWWCIATAITLLALAVFVSIRRRDQGRRPGAATMVLLILATLALYGAWRAYFPPCPPNVWC
ncbi:MAG TPA: hypothetical protein VF883_03755 [Thermoanaerobaculia bacterium]|jgi:cytochrome bd-type quinol oxidase subunit 2